MFYNIFEFGRTFFLSLKRKTFVKTILGLNLFL